MYTVPPGSGHGISPRPWLDWPRCFTPFFISVLLPNPGLVQTPHPPSGGSSPRVLKTRPFFLTSLGWFLTDATKFAASHSYLGFFSISFLLFHAGARLSGWDSQIWPLGTDWNTGCSGPPTHRRNCPLFNYVHFRLTAPRTLGALIGWTPPNTQAPPPFSLCTALVVK